MWKRFLTLWVATVLCMPAASDAPAPSDAAAAPPVAGVATERAGLLPTEARRASELEGAFPDDAIVRIGDGDDRAIGVYRDALEPKVLGVVVVVLGAGLSPDAHVDSTSLRRSLARKRWATLTVALPDIPNETLPPRQRDKFVEGATAAQPAPDPAAAKPAEAAPPAADPMPARVRARLDAALKAARPKGTKVVMLGEGAAGAWVAWAQLQGLGADAVITINTPRDAPRIDGKRPKDVLAVFKSPALMLIEAPLYWSVDDRLAADVELRLIPPGNPSGARLDRQVQGWLKRRFDSRG
jgi:hypothetical protein